MKQDSFWEEMYKKGDPLWSKVKEKDAYVFKAAKLVQGNKKLPYSALDIGCGTGKYSGILFNQGFNVIGVDISKSAINLSRQPISKSSLNSLTFVQSDILNFKIKEKFDLILDLSCFTHLHKRQWRDYIAKINKMLKPGGVFLLSGWSKRTKQIYGKDTTNLKKDSFAINLPGYGKFHNHLFGKNELREIFSKNFSIEHYFEERCLSLKDMSGSSSLYLFFAFMKKE